MGRYNMKFNFRVTSKKLEQMCKHAGVKTITITVLPSADGWNEKVGIHFNESISKIINSLEDCEYIAFHGDLNTLIKAKNRKLGRLRTSTFGRCVYIRLISRL